MTIGEGDILVIDLKKGSNLRVSCSTIRLLSCFIVNETSSSFDVLAANGRAEIVRLKITTSPILSAMEPN